MREYKFSDEDKILWRQLLKPMRWGKDSNSVLMQKDSTEFAKDHDRIIFSSAFRRLAKKTQVHPLIQNDHIHNRLTHSLEVSCVGRSLGNKLGIWLENNGLLPEGIEPYNVGEIVQAACLAHDIGNPPFGHAGEDAIQDWFNNPENNSYLERGKLTEWELADFKAFDGNAQGFRIVTSLEMYKDEGGMRLSFPTLASIIKYPFCSLDGLKMDKRKFNFYCAEANIFDKIFCELGLKKCNKYIRHPLSYLTEAADDICYLIIDIEDARELKIIDLDDLHTIINPIEGDLNIKHEKLEQKETDRRKSSYIRALLINHLVNIIFETFICNFRPIIEGYCNPLYEICEEKTQRYFKNARKIFKDRIMKDPKKTALEIGSYSVYKRLLDNFIPAAHNKVLDISLSYKQTRALDLMGINAPEKDESIYYSYLRVIDFVSGMTDEYATFISRQLAGV